MYKNSPRKGSPGSSTRNVPHTRLEDENEFEKVYEFRRELGRGSFGRVYEAQCQTTGLKWAVKSVNKEKAGSYAVKMLEREVNIMKMIDHQHVVCLNEVYETPTKMFLVMELCDQGELCDLLRVRKTLTENEALTVIRQLTDAIAYLHDLDIVHRDLKLENILLCKPVNDEPINIKISDFGLSYIKGSGEAMMQSVCGTPMYMAPEVIDEHEYSRQCDIWSIGVILFTLLTGSPPFQAPTEEKLYQLIKQGHLDFTHPCWQTINESAKNVLEGMLEVDPAHRSTAMEIKDHPWVNGDNESSARVNVIQMMKEYNAEQKKLGMYRENDAKHFAIYASTTALYKALVQMNPSNHNNNIEETQLEDSQEKPVEVVEQNNEMKNSPSKTSLKKETKVRKKSPGHLSSRIGKSSSTSQLNSLSSRENSGKKKTPSYMQPTQSSSAPTNPSVRTMKNRKNTDKTR